MKEQQKVFVIAGDQNTLPDDGKYVSFATSPKSEPRFGLYIAREEMIYISSDLHYHVFDEVCWWEYVPNVTEYIATPHETLQQVLLNHQQDIERTIEKWNKE